jgi:hypothetical protein
VVEGKRRSEPPAQNGCERFRERQRRHDHLAVERHHAGSDTAVPRITARPNTSWSRLMAREKRRRNSNPVCITGATSRIGATASAE